VAELVGHRNKSPSPRLDFYYCWLYKKLSLWHSDAMETKYDVIVVGGGPAGMMAAGRAGELGARVLLLEKNDQLGKKLKITGGRRCNITNAEFDNRIFLENFENAKHFLFSPFSQFNVENTFEFFEGRGLPLMVEDRKRAFPQSERAEDVSNILQEYVEETGNVWVKLGSEVTEIIKVIANGKKYLGNKIIIATGGLAAPETGSTGEIFDMLSAIGHKVEASDTNLAPLKTPAEWVHLLAGALLEEMTLRYIQANKVKFKETGRLLFTHFGISGPLVINSAFKVGTLLRDGEVEASIDLFPRIEAGDFDKMILDLFEANKNKMLRNVLADLLQKKLLEVILTLPGLRIGEKQVNAISKEERKLLTKTLKDLRFPISGTMGLEWGIIADGGVVPREVDFKTMQSKIYPNLYLIGDTLHINRPSGGFSLQLCWTTGYIAGSHSAS